MACIRMEGNADRVDRGPVCNCPAPDALGPLPREALAALVDYGLTDAEIATYHALPTEIVTRLRMFWGIRSGL